MSLMQLILRIVLCLSLISGLSGRAMAMENMQREVMACHHSVDDGHTLAVHGAARNITEAWPVALNDSHPCHEQSKQSHSEKTGMFKGCATQCQLICDSNATIVNLPADSLSLVMVSLFVPRSEALSDAPKVQVLRPPIFA